MSAVYLLRQTEDGFALARIEEDGSGAEVREAGNDLAPLVAAAEKQWQRLQDKRVRESFEPARFRGLRP